MIVFLLATSHAQAAGSASIEGPGRMSSRPDMPDTSDEEEGEGKVKKGKGGKDADDLKSAAEVGPCFATDSYLLF